MTQFDYITCSCGGEGIQIWHDNTYGQTYFAMFEVQPGIMTFRERVRRAWTILRGKTDIFNDQMVLEKEHVAKLIETLQKTQQNADNPQ